MPPNKVIKADSDLVEKLCSIASVSKVIATNLLEACDNNLEMAVNMQMEGVITDTNGTSTSNLDDNVRAPIPQRQEVLVDGPDQLSYSFRGRNRVSRSVFDKFRDFEAEAKRQEEELMLECSTSSAESSTSKKRKMKTLEDLFRPPLDLMFRGSFQSAREAGINTKKWLLVNIQNSSEFPCQVLNRDVWSNSAVKTIVQEHFVFWQIYYDSEDGQRYMNFYPVTEWPYIAVIDPRTGERLVHWQKMDAVSFCELITEFLSSHPSLDDSSTFINDKTSPPTKKLKSNDSIIEADESAQIEAAIQASLASSQKDVTNGDEDDDDDDSGGLETFDSDSADDSRLTSADVKPTTSFVSPPSPETSSEVEGSLTNGNWLGSSKGPEEDEAATEEEKEEDEAASEEEKEEEEEVEEEKEEYIGKERWKRYLGKETDPESRLILRLPDGSRESLQMPSSSKLMALVLYVSAKGFNNESYELVTNFPKRRLSYLDFDSTLKSVGLFPQETVFVQKR